MIKCGVNPQIFKAYDFKDQQWDRSPDTADLNYHFSNIAISTAKGYMIRDVTTNVWCHIADSDDAKNKVINERTGRIVINNSLTTVDSKYVELYFKNYIPYIGSTITIPLGPDFVIFNGQKYVNDFVDMIIRGEESKASCSEVVLRIIREALCGHNDVKTYQEMIDIINGKDRNKENEVFVFVMMWLASCYQAPGVNQQTNLWFIGKTKGIGKGTILQVLRALVGGRYVRKASAEDIDRGWNDVIEGSLFVEADEFESSKKTDSNKIIKRDTTNEVVTIAKRNTHTRDIINIANWIFTSNNEHPLYIEEGDRRNVFVHTTYNLFYKEFTHKFNLRFTEDKAFREDVLMGLAFVLGNICVDHNIIKTAIDTDLKLELVEDSKNALEAWLTEGKFERDTEIQANAAFDQFKAWADVYAESTKINNTTAFGRNLRPYIREGKIIKSRSSGGYQYKFISEYFPEMKDDNNTYGTSTANGKSKPEVKPNKATLMQDFLSRNRHMNS